MKSLFMERKTFRLKSSSEVAFLANEVQQHFQNLKIKNFKIFQKELEIKGFRQVNIIAGENNVGKTALLEAIYLLANLNNEKGVFSTCQTRGKLTNKIDGETLEWLMPNDFGLKGDFDNNEYEVALEKFEATILTLIPSNHRASYRLLAKIKETALSTTIKIFNAKPPEVLCEERRKQICAAIFLSATAPLNVELLEKSYDAAFNNGALILIIQFLKQNIDENIFAVNKIGTGKLVRFVVVYKNLESYDITQFGTGLQQIFYIGILMASAQNGVICIDEIENAIHHRLFIKFTRFIQKMAEQLNIQIFATSQSDELIKAFFENKYNNDAVAGFRLIRDKDTIRCATASGEAFETLLKNFLFDLRG
jgi:AAA15 family ATPase/GTPase